LVGEERRGGEETCDKEQKTIIIIIIIISPNSFFGYSLCKEGKKRNWLVTKRSDI